MVLSSSTLNLKFMQRAAARNAQSSSSTPSAPSTPQASAPIASGSGSNAGPSSLSKSTTTPTQQSTSVGGSPAPFHVASAVEQAANEEVWFIPRAKRATTTSNSGAGSSTSASRNWTFEPSYVPFLAKGREGSSGGGGRMKFGFGEEEKEEVDVEENGDVGGMRRGKGKGKQGEGSDDEEMVATRRTAAQKPKIQPLLPPQDRSFHRPKGFENDRQRPDKTSSTPASSSARPVPSTTAAPEKKMSKIDQLRSIAAGKKRKHDEAVKTEDAEVTTKTSAVAVKDEAKGKGDGKAAGLKQQEADTVDSGEASVKKAKKKKSKADKKAKKAGEAPR